MATTTTAAYIADSSSSSSFMLPGMTSPELENYSRVVRFNGECVLIPEASPRSKIPVVSTKSYALPLWKRKATQSSELEVEDTPRRRPGSPPSPDDSRVVLKVPIPTFRTRSSRSPSRGRSVSTSPVIPRALPSCLVHRSPSTSSNTLSPVRRPSLPTYHRRKDERTVPLRACCPDCERITEECLKEGEQWQEKFSRGASRRRSASLDHNDRPGNPQTHHHTRSGGFPIACMSMEESPITPSRFASSASTFTLTVDEVDKRRRSQDFSADDGLRALSPSHSTASTSTTYHSIGFPFSSAFPRHPPSSMIHDRDVSSSSTNSSTSTSDEHLLDILDPRRRLRSSPIEEEDEAQLFPLPRRSPSSTPSPSVSPKASPLPSPNASTSFLPGTMVASPFSSKDSLVSKASSSQESLLKSSLSRKAVNGYLAAPGLASSKLGGSSTSSTATSSPLAPSPPKKVYGLRVTMSPMAGSDDPAPLSPKGPRAPVRPSSVRAISNPERTSNQVTPPAFTSTTASISSIPLPVPSSPSNVSRQKPLVPLRLSAPSSSSPSSPAPLASPTKATAHSPTSDPSSRSSTGKRKHSFTAPFLKAGEAIRDVGVDVLKGVSSMGVASP